LDGRIARLTGTTSEFGLQFDSLADVVSFGIAPAFLSAVWAPPPIGRVSIPFLFVVCAAMRLARFNIGATAGQKSLRFFAGLPSPAAAGLVATLVFTFPTRASTPELAVLRTAVVLSGALLMISRFRYRSFKELDLRSRRSFVYVLVIAGLMVPILTWPQGTLLILAVGYVVSGPVTYVVGWIMNRNRRDEDAEESGGVEVADEPNAR
jgi:CDP-diacylglycerol--serine O-phosphatidyltransferase